MVTVVKYGRDDEEATRLSLIHANGTVITVVRDVGRNAATMTLSSPAPQGDSDDHAPMGKDAMAPSTAANEQGEVRKSAEGRAPPFWKLERSRPDMERLDDFGRELGLEFERVTLKQGSVAQL